MASTILETDSKVAFGSWLFMLAYRKHHYFYQWMLDSNIHTVNLAQSLFFFQEHLKLNN
jgi:hypothetical protein